MIQYRIVYTITRCTRRKRRQKLACNHISVRQGPKRPQCQKVLDFQNHHSCMHCECMTAGIMNINFNNLNPFGFIQQMREPFQSSGSKQYQLRYKLTAYRSDISPEFHRTENYGIIIGSMEQQ